MKNILVVLGSARRGRVADAVASHITAAAEGREDVSLTIADLVTLNLPFFDNEVVPGDPAYAPTDPSVVAWAKLVAEADSVIFVTPEYNHTLTAIMKNSIDSLFKEWNDKPIGVVAYGWYGGANSLVTLREIATVTKFDIKAEAKLFFTKDIATDGALLEDGETSEKINAVLDALQ